MMLKFGSTALVIVLAAATAHAQTFTETFEAGIPATWTTIDYHAINPGIPDFSACSWTVNTVESMGNYTAGTGLAATASSFNHPGQYDISLFTPKFKLNAGADGTSVAYTINFYRVDAFEAFDTNLSINGGPWVTMVHETASEGPHYSTGPPKVSIAIGLGFFGAAIGDTAQVEFHYYSTFLLPMVHNEYIEIDNVRTPTYIPEPTTGVLAFTALLLAAARRKRRACKECHVKRDLR
jgi:hypothetical protein